MSFNFTIKAAAIVLLLIIYWRLLFKLVEPILAQGKIKRIYYLSLSIVNTVVIFAFQSAVKAIYAPFIIMLALMLLEFAILYRCTLLQSVFCAFACIIHVLLAYTLVVGALAVFTGDLAFESSVIAPYYMLSRIIILIVLDIAIVLVTKLLPLERIRIINQHSEPQGFLIIWMAINIGFLLYNNSAVYKTQACLHLAGTQVTLSLNILIGLYVVAFFAIKTVTLLGYKEKSTELAQAMAQEQQYRNSITKDAVVSYEVNLTQNRILHGFEDKRQELGDIVDCYSKMLAFTARKIVHAEDMAEFTSYSAADNLLREYKLGKSETSTEYRRLTDSGEYVWVRSIVNLLKELDTGDLIAYVHIKNIDSEKRQQLVLQHMAERDPLTSLYNKEITGKAVNEKLTAKVKPKQAALFMIDADDFKAINDHLGHSFGDAVLCELADKLRNIFDTQDILGRIGGDEYIAYTQRDSSAQNIKTKAEEILSAFRLVYKDLQKGEYSISASIGVAVYPKDGISFEELYKSADSALYKAKRAGKGRYRIYDGSGFVGYEQNRTEIQARQEIMNHLNNFVYVINPQSFEVLFMNEQTRKRLGKAKCDMPCYRFFRDRTKQCEDCPILALDASSHQACREIYNDKLCAWTETTASLMRWTDGSYVYLIECADISKQKEEHLRHIKQLEKLAYTDELTGISNFCKFKKDAEQILQKQQAIAHFLVKLDIDNFKLINQLYGYEKGNEILCFLAKALKKTVRNKDEIYARISSDEFVALFANESPCTIDALYDKFINIFNTLIASDFAFKFAFPHGIYIIEANAVKTLDINDLFEKVNIAHKVAKRDKSKKFVFYNESMTQKALRDKEIENKMASALLNEEFAVYLQPKYYLDTGAIGGAEALSRWQNDNVDLFYPDAFIDVFERNGFITRLDFYVLHKVCCLIKAWIEAGIEPVVISVNFSRLHLNNCGFVNKLCDTVDELGIDRKYIEIEITETVIYDNIDTFESLLLDLHKSGFSISMDDFGSGYSSLGLLKDLPVDIIKMDRSFFANQKDAERSKIVVGSIISMASSLGIRIVAEGVEEQEHIDLLRSLHCDMVQGYYYARPMPMSDFTQLIKPI